MAGSSGHSDAPSGNFLSSRVSVYWLLKRALLHGVKQSVISLTCCSRILWVCIIGLVSHGLGIAAQLVASFTDALRTSM
jgi:hypothetical protein